MTEHNHGGKMEFKEFKSLPISEIEKWKHIKLSDADIKRWRKNGSLVNKLFEFKLKKLHLEYLKIKIQNQLAAEQAFQNYDPIKEAEKILAGL